MMRLPQGAAIILLGPSADDLAQRLKAHLPQSVIHAFAPSGVAGDRRFEHLGPHLRMLFATGTPIIGICATGILIRALAPLITDKQSEPAVVAVAEDGSTAVPVLGGHRGANVLARVIAVLTGGSAAITTAGDLRFDLALDEPPPGWRVANPARAKDVMVALLAGADVALSVEAGDAAWLQASGATFVTAGSPGIRITDRAVASGETDLVLHPPVLALGVGCERGASAEEVTTLVATTLDRHGLAVGAVALIASLDIKSDEPAIHALAASFGGLARFFTARELAAETPRLQRPSEAVFRAVGCYGVAEGAALAAVGAEGALIVPKQSSARATCAIARAPTALEAAKIGRARGKLSIIGIGPGDAATRTGAAEAALEAASDVVGYRLYLDLLGPLLAGKTRHEGTLGAEEDRVRQALDLAASGRNVALVSSGDAGIYGLATLAFELLDHTDRADWKRAAIDVIPGVSAMQAAAARLGAPLGHDFCAISLSDLLTPWKEIEHRLAAAAGANFVIALYNPRSMRRVTQLQRAKEILCRHRSGGTPVALARNLGRDGEAVDVTTLEAFGPEQVDMLTIVLIGNDATRQLAGRPLLYTPRGYAGKRPA